MTELSPQPAMEKEAQTQTVVDGHVQHVDISLNRQPPFKSGKAVNAYLLFACATFGSATFIFGFDDRVISPIAALEPFVSLYLLFQLVFCT